MSSYARDERAALADLLLEVGPDAPTLCEGWTTRDLAAHLVVREARPDAAAGIVIRPLAGWTARVQSGAAGAPYDDLVSKVRSGPPLLSVFSLPGADEAANTLEYFVHHEDVRRARPGWQPRALDPGLADALWSRVSKGGRLFFGSSPVGVTLRRTDGEQGPVDAVVKQGEPAVTITGDVGDLVMLASGRTAVHVQVDGTAAAVRAFDESTRRL